MFELLANPGCALASICFAAAAGNFTYLCTILYSTHYLQSRIELLKCRSLPMKSKYLKYMIMKPTSVEITFWLLMKMTCTSKPGTTSMLTRLSSKWLVFGLKQWSLHIVV
jgi:hypothetical protein